MTRQDLADKLTNEVLTEIYGERFTELDNIEDDKELDNDWEHFNEQFYDMLKYYYGDDEVLN
jgi:hypothetical protein